MRNGLRKICAVAAAMMLSTNVFSIAVYAENDNISITEDNSIESTAVRTAEELMNMKSDGIYHLAGDIDLSGIKWRSVRNFEGTFDGNGYEIKNLESNTYGLFAELKSNAVIKNVKLTNVKIMSKYKTVGGIAAVINGSVKNVRIDNCFVSGFVFSRPEKHKGTAGGILGKNSSESSVISNCYSNALVCAKRQAGGIAGINKGTVMNSGFGGVIENSMNVHQEGVPNTDSYTYLYCYGGICGFNYGTVQNCLSNFTDKACGTYGGGIVGAGMKDSKITDCVNLTKMWLDDDMNPGLIAGYASKKAEISGCYTRERNKSMALNNIGKTSGKFNVKTIAENELSDDKLLKKLGDEWCMENNLPAPVSIREYTLTYRLYDVKADILCPAITGWHRAVDGWRYHDEETGIMSVGEVEINGKKYTFSENGIWNGKADYDNTKIYNKLIKELSKDDYGGIYLDNNVVVVLSTNNNAVKKITDELKQLYAPIVVNKCRYSANKLEKARAHMEKNRKRYGISAISTDVKNNRIEIVMKKENSSLNAYLNAVGNDIAVIEYAEVVIKEE